MPDHATAAANRAEAFIARRRAAGLRSNRLLREGSPYLLQHAFNPVDWYPWGEEAFAAAAAADKPLFVSIGYSTCHWCHVMEHESFEDEAIAALMNEHFVNVKIDREERPDVDRIYMTVVQAVTGSGGWPMSVFLTPQRLPFYAGTYFPPRSAYGRPGFEELLQFLARHWRERRAEVEATAARITTAVRQATEVRPATGVAGGEVAGPPAAAQGPDLLAAVADGLAPSFDTEYGGFGAAPKFPRPAVFAALFQHYRRAGSEPSLEMALETLRQMARGGMCDHLGGGFHRYSVDRYWRVPHFEKMLYDQAQLAAAYTAAYQITGDQGHATVAAATLDYLLHDLQAPEGGFYSAEDADSARDPERPEEKVEGAFYLWSTDQVRDAFQAAGATDVEQLIADYGLTAEGNTLSDPHGEFGDGNVLYRARGDGPLPERWRAALTAARDRRARPLLDDKIIAAWNGLAITALAAAGRVLQRHDFVTAATAAAAFVRRELVREGRLLRRYRAGEARHAAGLADYSYLVEGLLELYQGNGEVWLLELAGQLADAILELFAAPNGALYDTPGGQTDLIVRTSELYDSAEPSGTAAAVLGLLRLGRLTGRADWQEAARRALAAVAGAAAAQPTATPLLALAADLAAAAPVEVVLAGEWEETAALRHELARHYLPEAVVVHLHAAAAPWWRQRHPAVAAMSEAGPGTRAYVCRNFTCDLPVTTPAALSRQLLSA